MSRLPPDHFLTSDRDVERQQSETEHTQMANTEVDYKPNAADDDPPPFNGPFDGSDEMLPLYADSHIQREVY